MTGRIGRHLVPAVALALALAGAPAAMACKVPVAGGAVVALRGTGPDTVALADGREVRLAGIAPGGGAAAALNALVAGRRVLVRPVARDPDRWNRVLAHLDLAGPGGGSVEAALLARGLGHAAARARGACLAPLLASEAAARAARLGVWAEPHYVVAATDAEELTRRLGRHVMAEGRVVSARAVRDRIYVNFARYGSPGLSIVVRRRDWPAVSGGVDVATVAALRGRRARVRGHLEWRGRMLIEANAREPLEWLDRRRAP